MNEELPGQAPLRAPSGAPSQMPPAPAAASGAAASVDTAAPAPAAEPAAPAPESTPAAPVPAAPAPAPAASSSQSPTSRLAGAVQHGRPAISLSMLLLLGMSVLLAVLFVAFLVLDTNTHRQETERALHEEASMFAREMDAVWNFMDYAQYTINNSSAGYEFKRLHCAVVGKSVGAIFSKNNDYVIRYTNFNPRNVQDYPDAFETEALTLFNDDRTVEDYSGIAEYLGEENYRYVRKLDVDASCLTCHGSPVGTVDETGFLREGWTLDSVGGAISIIIPIERQQAEERERIRRDVVAFLAIATIAFLFVFALVSFFVIRPLNRMKRAFGTMQEGQLGVTVAQSASVSEVRDMLDEFNAMSGELRDMYDNIESQVKDRTIDLRRANELLEVQRDDLSRLNLQLAKETQFKTDLLSMVNHELRTPLTAITTLAQISSESAQDDSPEKAAWGEIETNSRILLDMINDMLDVARSDAGMITATHEVVDLGDIVYAVRGSLHPIAERYQVELSTHVDGDVPLVMGDYEKTTRIFANLVSNAVKFTPDGGHVRVLVERAPDGGVLCHVADDGIGIAPEDQQRIFEKFVQVDSTSTRKYAGSGLGLAIVRQYADLQGFSASVASAPGVGSTFTVTIPPSCVVQGGQDV